MKKPIRNIFIYAPIALIFLSAISLKGQSVVAVPDYTGTNINTPVTVNVLSNDINVTPNGIIDKVVLVNNCTAVISHNNLIITPNQDFVGVALLNYTVCSDGTRTNCSTGLVAVNVAQQPTPIYDEQTLYVKPGQKTQFTLPAIYNSMTQIPRTDSGGTVKYLQQGLYSYTPYISPAKKSFVGHDQVLLQTYNNNGEPRSLLLNFEVLNIPVARKYAVDDYVYTKANTSTTNNTINFDLLGNDKTPQGIQIDNTNVYGGQIVSVNNGAGAITFRPQAGFKGIATIPYTITTPEFTTETATAFITVSDFAPAKDVFEITAPSNRLVQFAFSYQCPVSAKFINISPANGSTDISGSIAYFQKPYTGLVNGIQLVDSNLFIYTPPSILTESNPQFNMRYCITDDCSQYKNVSITVHLTSASNCGSGVFAGDTNNDGIVDMADLYAVARNMGTYGTARANSNIDWNAKCATDWNVHDAANGNLDLKYADADGDGIVTAADTSAISNNYGLTNTIFAEKTAQPSSLAVQLISPVTAVHPGDMVEIQVSIGSTEIPAVDLSGLSFNVNFDPKRLNTSSVAVDFDKAGFMLQYNAAIWLNKITANGTLTAALVRSLAKPASGHGTIGKVHGVVIDDVAGFKQGDQQYLTVRVPEMSVTNDAGQEISVKGSEIRIPILPKDDKAVLQSSDLHIFPNPSSVKAEFYLNGVNEMESLRVVDATGRIVKFVSDINSKQLMLPTNDLAHGLYIVDVKTTKGSVIKKLIVE